MTTHELLSHRHPLVILQALPSLGGHDKPQANRVYAELERGLERWGWQRCHGEPAAGGKRMKCEAGQVRKGKFLYRCGACKGKGGYMGDPYDNDQATIRQGAQKPSTFTVSDFASLVLDMDNDPSHEGGKAIDRATWMLEQRMTTDTDTSTSTSRPAENPAVTELRIAFGQLATLDSRPHGVLNRVYVDQWTRPQDMTALERAMANRGLTHLSRLLPVRWCAPRECRVRATEAHRMAA